jgi:hypothetical protein
MKQITLFLAGLAISFASLAQVPSALNFQAVARDAGGAIMNEKSVGVTFAIHKGLPDGITVFSEEHHTNTNPYGLFSLQIGSGNRTAGALADIDWGSDSYWLEVMVNGVSVGTQQLVTVPYAFVAQKALEDAVEDADADPTNELQQLSIEGTELTITGGNTVTLPANDPESPNDNTLDESYDQDGPGVGRWIMADMGAVWIQGPDGLHVDGNVGIGTTTPSVKHHVHTPSATWSMYTTGSTGTTFPNGLVVGYQSVSTPAAFVYNAENSPLFFATNAVIRQTIDGSGNVGIGTSAPTARLHLNGSLRIVNGSEAAGRILSSDAAGNATWIDPPSGGGGGGGFDLDSAYNFGGPGAGRSIDAVDGAIDVAGEDGFQVTGTFEAGDTIELVGEGARLVFNPNKAAFRAGVVFGDSWDNFNVGQGSVAMGFDTKASGFASVATGQGNISSGDISYSSGAANTASGVLSTAIGFGNTASNFFSMAIGNGTSSTANSSISIGSAATASGDFSIAMGNNVSTDAREGAFVLGDNSTFNVTTASSNNEFTSRFAGGYRLYSNSSLSSGVVLPPNGNAWLIASDINKKENLVAVDAEAILRRIGAMELTTWNYKEQDPATTRHYGPMAQDFYAAFGRDAFGTIGSDTMINQADFDGINLIGIQALEHRTTALSSDLSGLKAENALLRAQIDMLARLVQAQGVQLSRISSNLGITVGN